MLSPETHAGYAQNIALMELSKLAPSVLWRYKLAFTPRDRPGAPHTLPGRRIDGKLDENEPWCCESQCEYSGAEGSAKRVRADHLSRLNTQGSPINATSGSTSRREVPERRIDHIPHGIPWKDQAGTRTVGSGGNERWIAREGGDYDKDSNKRQGRKGF